MYILTINKQKYYLKTAWEELTCNEFFKLLNSQTTAEKISALSGCDIEILKQITPAQATDLELFIKFTATDLDIFALSVPKEIEILKKKIKIPQQIELETWGQKLIIEEELKKYKDKPLHEIFTFIPAVYLAPYYFDKKFNESQITELEPILKDMLLIEVFPIANFFFINTIKSFSESLNSLQELMTQTIKEQELMNLTSSVTSN